ncbi:unnamed protein product (macronuclear) [Paramecium tetraurelia]|uniref:CCT domain-containing protein n=1 Tax=Paramecium tetraurelia TaxID=5888 RepID=A0DKZ4_PARTE|nr:uncharacterized protein GSPATT00018028001 [Paramecium tetraurelia]CAK83711.1 unnamed protein product [Paramecium tetraurelia]|eukprot:XP_001451108.1 hypothetical protein (macronuclear) [Paramecium tetraurelia strain d4-2]
MINQSDHESLDSQLVEQEPSIQQIKSIRVQSNHYSISNQQQKVESDSLDTLQSIFDSEQEQRLIFETISNISTTNTIKQKKKKLKRVCQANSFRAKLAQRTRIQSFRLDEEACSQDEEESLPQNLMQVDLQFREEAIFSVQKIIETRKNLII